MDLVVAGSNPVIHPDAFVAQLDRAMDFESIGRLFESGRTQEDKSCRIKGAHRAGFFGPLAQLVEQQTLNLRVASSILARLKELILYIIRN